MKVHVPSLLAVLCISTLSIVSTEAETIHVTSNDNANANAIHTPRSSLNGDSSKRGYSGRRRRTRTVDSGNAKYTFHSEQKVIYTNNSNSNMNIVAPAPAPAPTPPEPIKKCKKFYKAPSKGTEIHKHPHNRRRMAVPGEIYNTQHPQLYKFQDTEALNNMSVVKPILPKSPSKGTGSDRVGSQGAHMPSKGAPSKGSNIIWIDECEYPSAAPSLSQMPSFQPTSMPSAPPTKAPTQSPTKAPTRAPTQSPTKAPTKSPTKAPTVSPQPTTSPQPTSTFSPSNNPTMTHSPGCQALQDGTVFAEGEEASQEYYYQLVTTDGADISTILTSLDSALRNAIGYELVYCGDKLMRGYNSGNSRALSVEDKMNFNGIDFQTMAIGTSVGNRSLRIDGLDMMGPDEEVGDAYQCNDLVDVNSGQVCNVYKGSFKVYYRDGTFTEHQAKEKVLKQIRDTMNNEEAKTDMLSEVDDAWDISFGDGDRVNGRNQNADGAVLGGVNDSSVNGGLSGIGIAMVASASVIGVLFLFAASRRREHSKLQVMEQVIEDDESIFDKSVGFAMSTDGTEVFAGSDKMAHVLGDDDSVFSGLDDDRYMSQKRLYGMGSRSNPIGPRENNLGLRGNALNVHTCTSATCEICGRNADMNSPTFVPTDFGPDERDVCTPIYSDTVDIDMAERPYASPDTVDM